MRAVDAYLDQFSSALDDARRHARACFPEESCGFIVNAQYVPLSNRAADPELHHVDAGDCPCRLCRFVIAPEEFIRHQRFLQAVVHSHPNGPTYPSEGDMRAQLSMGLPWIIIPLDVARFGAPIVWGRGVPKEKIIGREFCHGVTDCYELIRDVFELGRVELKAQGITGWPLDPITLPQYPRADAWWEGTSNFYEEEPQKIGFVEVGRDDARPGDIFLCRIRSDRLNHAGVLLENHLVLHHLPNRLSRREPSGIWTHCAEKWIRYEGTK